MDPRRPDPWYMFSIHNCPWQKYCQCELSARKTSQGGRDYCMGDLWGITFSTKSDALDLQDLSRIAWSIKGCTLFFLVVENSLSPATSRCCLPSRHLRVHWFHVCTSPLPSPAFYLGNAPLRIGFEGLAVAAISRMHSKCSRLGVK